MHPLRRALGVERAQRLGSTSAQRPDLGAVVVVGDLSRPVVELELLQRSQRAVTLLGESDPLLLVLRGLVEAVVGSPRVTQERRGHEQHARDGEKRAEREPHQLFAGAYLDGHFVTSVSRLATKVPWAKRPSTTTWRPSLNWSGTLPR